MIDLLKDECLLLKKAGALCRWAGPKGVPYSTVIQWVKKGIKGIKLEAVYTPQGMVTTMPSIVSFMAALTKKKQEEQDHEQAAVVG